MTDTNQLTTEQPKLTLNRSRRDILRRGTGLATTLSLPALARRTTAGTGPDYQEARQTIEISAPADQNEVALYQFNVTGSLRAAKNSEDDSDQAAAWVRGRVGPGTDTDTYEFTGEITAFQKTGPITVRVNGFAVDPDEAFSQYRGEITEVDINAAMTPPGYGEHVIRFTNPRELTGYEMRCKGVFTATKDSTADMGDYISVGYQNGYVTSHLGPASDTDTYGFNRELIHFSLIGNCDVFVDGKILTSTESRPEPEPSPPSSTQNMISITSTGENKVAVYQFSVSATLSTTSDSADDTAGGHDAFGRVGPMSGTDTFEYTGAITDFQMAGPAVVRMNGTVVDVERELPTYRGAMTVDDIEATMDPSRTWHTIQFTNPTTITAYELEVVGTIQPTSDTQIDLPSANTYVTSHIGPTSGTDTYEFTGSLRHFVCVGACDVYVDGATVTPGSG